MKYKNSKSPVILSDKSVKTQIDVKSDTKKLNKLITGDTSTPTAEDMHETIEWAIINDNYMPTQEELKELIASKDAEIKELKDKLNSMKEVSYHDNKEIERLHQQLSQCQEDIFNRLRKRLTKESYDILILPVEKEYLKRDK